MTKHLPVTPNLRHLHTQAKDLLELCKFGDPIAIEQIRSPNSAFSSLTLGQLTSRVRLCDAQLAVAQSYGFKNWPALSAAANQIHKSTTALSKALEDPRMEDLDFRTGIARCKGLPAIGTSRVSEHGVRYDVTDYMPAVTPAGATRARAGGLDVHINDLLPIISFPEMSEKLYELYIETDCVTTKPLIFFDTVPYRHPSTAAPGLNQVLTLNVEAPLYIHFDAEQFHETVIAHELGHIWIEKVEQIEDYRHPRDQSDLPKITQFYHIQSFVMDLCVNDMLARRGFDMSIIARHQAEAICNFAANCARGEKPKTRRVLAAVINAMAGALLEMERFPDEWSATIKNALTMIQIGLPEAFEPAKGFVQSVLRHGYNDSAAVMRVVNECAALSYAATGENFDPDTDLVEVPNVEPKWDKRPEFLKFLPVAAKLEVCREAARRGITGCAKYDIVVGYPYHASVTVTEPGEATDPIRLSFNLPGPPPNRHLMPGAPVPNLRPGSAYIPPPGMPYPGSSLTVGVQTAKAEAQHSATPGFNPPAYSPSGPDPFAGLPEQVRAMLQHSQPPGFTGATSYVPAGMNSSGFGGPIHGKSGSATNNTSPDPWVEVQRRNEELSRKQAEEDYRRRLLQMQMLERHYESYSGSDLKPFLTPSGEEYAKLHPRHGITGDGPVRNYMAGLGRWISQVGFEEQMAGEHVYGYAYDNPVTYTDPSGKRPAPDPRCDTRTCGNRCSTILRHLRDVCKNRIKYILYPELAECLTKRCNNIRISCSPMGSKICPPGTFGVTLGPPFTTTNRIFICSEGFKRSIAGCLGKTILHEMIHSCGDSEGLPDVEYGAEGVCTQPAYAPGTEPCPDDLPQ